MNDGVEAARDSVGYRTVVSFDDYRRSTALLLQANVAPIFYPCCSNEFVS